MLKLRLQDSFIGKLSVLHWHLLLIFLLLVFAILYTNIIENNFGNTFSTKKIQKRILKVETEFDNTANEIEDLLSIQKGHFFFSESQIEDLNKKGINSFVFYHDSLIAWSDNEFIPIVDNTNSLKKGRIVKYSDGYYFVKLYKNAEFTIVNTFLIKHDYPFENEYLSNRLNPALGLNKELLINFNTGKENIVKNSSGGFLFSIEYPETQITGSTQSVILFLTYSLLLILFFNLIYLIFHRKFKGYRFVLLFSTSIILIRIALQLLRVPDVLFESDIFNPGSFAINLFFPSLGDLFLSVYSLFIIILAGYKNLNLPKQIMKLSPFVSYILALLTIGLTFLFLAFSLNLVENLIINSNIQFDISNFFSLNHLSFIGLIIISLIVFILYFALLVLLSFYNKLLQKESISIGFALLTLFAVSITSLILKAEAKTIILLYSILLLVLIYSIGRKRQFRLQIFIPVFLLLALIISIAMNKYNYRAEHLRRWAIVRSVAINQDPQAEYLFRKIEKRIYKDSLLIEAFHNNDISFDSITHYIFKKYFEPESHWKKYDLQATICDREQELVIKPDNITVLCNDFFYRNLIAFGTLTSNKNLYHLNYGSGQINYLGLFRFTEHTQEGDVVYTIYLEINSKLKRKGFTKLLSEKGNDPFEKIRNYSLAAYENDTLTESYGQYSFPEILEPYMNSENEMYFIDHNGYDHLIYKSNDREVYVLSKKIPEKLTTVAPFSYLFILFTLLYILGALIFNHSLIRWHLEMNFTTRLQFSMILIIVVSFAIISYFSAHYIISLNNEKNRQRLKDLSSSLQMEFEHKVSDIDIRQTKSNADFLQSLSIKFSKVFDTDINLYDLNGNLITGTRTEIFEKHLLSRKINPIAYYKLSKQQESFYVAKENIGSLQFSSAFMPFHNRNREVVAYLNLPYFARQSELQNEVSSFLMTLMNVYTFIIVLSIIVILLISNYISRPLRMIQEKLQKLTLGTANEKIEWKGRDEIGKLVQEYNRMAEQLSIQADMLAKSERESAWREMAKQVAHEIKNPLTPMKLSVQYLLRSWDEKDPDREERLKRLSDTLIQQIDTLSDIATAFSDFAKMPKSNNEKIELGEIIQNAVELYADYENLQINFTRSEEHKFYVYADRKHLLRVFNNLIKNSIQSFDINQNGFIDIDIEEQITNYRIRIRDNGCGIPEDKKKLIFVPNFTTKSKGTGLGLAMVKNIILSFGGHISFESEEGKGTVFTIVLPKYEYKIQQEKKNEQD